MVTDACGKVTVLKKMDPSNRRSSSITFLLAGLVLLPGLTSFALFPRLLPCPSCDGLGKETWTDSEGRILNWDCQYCQETGRLTPLGRFSWERNKNTHLLEKSIRHAKRIAARSHHVYFGFRLGGS